MPFRPLWAARFLMILYCFNRGNSACTFFIGPRNRASQSCVYFWIFPLVKCNLHLWHFLASLTASDCFCHSGPLLNWLDFVLNRYCYILWFFSFGCFRTTESVVKQFPCSFQSYISHVCTSKAHNPVTLSGNPTFTKDE